MKTLKNNEGIALVTSLMFTMISLGIVMALLTIVTQGTRVSAANKTYKTAIEAGYGAVDVVSRDILPTIFKGDFNSAYLDPTIPSLALSAGLVVNNMNFPISDLATSCFNQKVGSSTASWSLCTAQSKNLVPKDSPDMTFNLKATNDPAGFNVFAKISDTRCGSEVVGQPCSNSDSSGIDYLDAGGGVSSSSGTVTPQHRPAYFRVEVQSERAVNPNEKSQLSVLYAY